MLQFVKFALVSLLLGAFVGAVCSILLTRTEWIVISWIPRYRFWFHGYELIAALLVTFLGFAAAIRRRPLVDLLAFLTAAVTGMTLSIVTLGPGNSFLLTFFGWLVFATVLTLLATVLAPDALHLFRTFWVDRPDATRGRERQHADDETNGR